MSVWDKEGAAADRALSTQEPYEAYMRRMHIETDLADRDNLKWDKRFMTMASLMACWSKDPSSQIGAIIVNDERRILATGYNGFPKGIEDTEERLNNRELKYPLIVHAETNALMNALYSGVSVKDASIYVYGLPVCPECAKLIIQSGIRRVVIKPNTPMTPQTWVDLWDNQTAPMFKEAGVVITIVGSPVSGE
jgi:dCMP deaminase